MILLKAIFTLNLALLALDHFYTGLLALLFPLKAVKVYSRLFGVQIPATNEYFAILKPWGALGIFAGIIGLLPIFDPDKYVLIIVALVLLLAMRLFYRLKFQKDTEKFLKLSRGRNLRHVGLILVSMFIMVAQIYYYTNL